MTKAAYSSHKTQSKYFFSSSGSFFFCSSAILFWSVLIARVCFFISRYNQVITIMCSDYLKRNMLHKFMLQVWQHVFLIYFFKILFFLKKFVSATKKNFKSIWNFFVVAEINFLRKKCCATKDKYLGTLKFFWWNCNNLKKFFQFHEKVASVTKALNWPPFNNEAKGSREAASEGPTVLHIDFCTLSNNSK